MRLCAELITSHIKSQTHLKFGEVSFFPHEGLLCLSIFFL
jgi:hypothetical protein